MKLLFFGDAAPTGFGTVTRDLGSAMIVQGHDVRFVSQNELDENLSEPFLGRTWTPADPEMFLPIADEGDSQFGISGLGRTALTLQSEGYEGFFNGRLWGDGWRPDAAIVLGDFGNVRLMVMRDERTRAAFATIPVYHYVPIEGVDLPPTLREMWQTIKPVAMCDFGAKEIGRLVPKPPVVFHGVDSQTFFPFAPERMMVIADSRGVIHKLRSKADAKRFFSIDPDRRIILRTDRNVPRKRYPELLRSMAPVLAERPDTTLVLHCNEFDHGGSLRDSIAKYHPRIQSQIVVTNAGGRMDRKALVALYNAADLYVTNSAEGFGLTIAEALACGVPVVGLDYSSVPEVVGPGGVVVKPASLVDNEYGYFWAGADQRTFGQAVAELIDDPVRRKALGRAGSEHVRACFSWHDAAERFAQVMGVMEAAA